MAARSPADELPQAGDILAGHYRLEKMIGEGGFGAVYIARDATLDREVAIKILRPSGEDDARALARFLREARATAALQSEHLTTIHEVAVLPEGPAYIAMELLRGKDLHDEGSTRGRIPAAEAVDWILEASLGLAHAHAVGIVHRDLKPRNLFLARRVDGTSVVKLLDFGIAKAGGDAEPLTETGTLLGTPRYMAPEQIRSGRRVDARADIWALGVVLYELTTGSPIFDAQGSAEIAAHILVEPPVPLRTRVPELPEAFAAVVHRCLEKDPALRFGDLGQLALALAPFATEPRRSIVPRIERVLATAAGQSIVDGLGPTRIDPRRGAPGDGGAASTASIDGAATTASIDGSLERSVARPIEAPPRASTTARPATLGIVAVVTLGTVGTIGVFVGRSGQPSAPVSVASPASPPLVSAQPQAPAPASSAASASPSASASASAARKVPPPAQTASVTPTKPSDGESDLISNACDSRSPTFLVPQNDGPGRLQCGRLALLGCNGIRARCASAPITDAEKVSCRDFQAALRDRGICR